MVGRPYSTDKTSRWEGRSEGDCPCVRVGEDNTW